jgi:hypothetical protein
MSTLRAGRSSRWIWYFVALALVTLVLLGWLALFIQQRLQPTEQLHLEELVAARQRWTAKGPKNYQMLYAVTRGGGASADTFFVEVREGKVTKVVLNEREHLPKEQLGYHSMGALFNDIEIFLKRDAQPGAPGTLCRGYFHRDDGHLMLFVRRVIGGPESVEIEVKEFRPLPAQ